MLKISLLHAPDYMILTPKTVKNLPTVGGGVPPPTPSPRSVASLPRICSQYFFWGQKSEIIPPTFKDLSTPLSESIPLIISVSLILFNKSEETNI